MATDNPPATESVAGDQTGDAYVSPLVDFIVLSLFVSILAVAAVAVILP